MTYDVQYRHNAVAGLVVTVGLIALAAVVWSQTPGDSIRDPRVFPPSSAPFGKFYGEWGAEWWQWVLSIPVSDNPFLDETGEKCVVGQRGPVWFLTGVLNISGTAIRTCSVPEGTALFVPIANTLRCGKVTPASEFGQDALPATSVVALAQVGIIATPSGQSATSRRFQSGLQRTREYACVGCAVAQRPAPAASCQQIEPPSACW